MKYEIELINKYYGLTGYKLINTQTSFILNENMLNNRTNAVKKAVSKMVKNRGCNVIFESITEMAAAYNFERSRLMHHITKLNLLPTHCYSDNINPIYVD